MADQPDPPDKWRVYEGDPTPDPEPEDRPTAPKVPYGGPPSAPVVIRTSSATSWVPKLILVGVAVVVLGVAATIAIAIISAVGGGIDAKNPDDFDALVDKLEEERGTTVVQDVNFYTNYIIVYMPYTDDPDDDRQISFTWRGGDLEEWTRGTSTDPTFDLKEIDTDVIDGMCDPVLAEADGAEEDDCYVFLSPPFEGSEAWFRASASDDFGRSVSVEYDKDGNEVSRTVP